MEHNTPRPKAYSYLRFSTPEQGKGDSHRRQADLAAQFAARHGLELDGSSFQDLGVSAFKGDNAATGALRQFRNAVESGVIPSGSFLLVESLDRLTRDHIVNAQTLFMSIITAGVTVVTLQPVERIYSEESLQKNPFDLIMAIIDMIRAHGESSVKAARLKEAWAAKRSRIGTVNLTSVAPAWLKARPGKDGFDIDEDRAAIIRGIFTDYIGGIGKHSISANLNASGVPPFGRAQYWRRSYIDKIVANPAAMGTFVPHTEERRDGKTIRTPCAPVLNYFPAVIDEETFRAAEAMAGRTGAANVARPRSGGVRHLLAGLARCPLCGASMLRISKGSTAKSGPPYLACSRAKQGAGCVYRAVRVSAVHDAILTGASVLVGTAPSGQAGLDDEWQALADLRDGIDTASGNLLDELGRGGKSRAIRQRLDAMQIERDRTSSAMDELAERIALTSSVFVGPAVDALGTLLDVAPGDLDVPRANAALRRVVNAVTVDYTTGQLVFTWAQGGESQLTYAMPLSEPE